MIKEFVNVEHGKLRTSIVEKEPYFCLLDVARLLNIKSVQECRKIIPSNDIKYVTVKKEKTKLFISAKYLTTCLFLSRKPEADMIYDWMFRTVLPQLVKYIDYKVEDFTDPSTVVQFLDEYQDLKIRNNILESTMKLDAPKLRFIEKLLGSTSCVDLDVVHEVVKYRGIRNNGLLKILRASYIIDEGNIPYQEFCDRKLFRVVESKVIVGGSVITTIRTFVYKSGIRFIEKILKEYEVTRNVKT
jgi:prophage antirepressor-like protein